MFIFEIFSCKYGTKSWGFNVNLCFLDWSTYKCFLMLPSWKVSIYSAFLFLCFIKKFRHFLSFSWYQPDQHVTYDKTFRVNLPPELYRCEGLFAWNRLYIWNLSDWKGIRTYNHINRKPTLNQIVQLAKWLICGLRTCLYHAFSVCIYDATCAFRVNLCSNCFRKNAASFM